MHRPGVLWSCQSSLSGSNTARRLPRVNDSCTSHTKSVNPASSLPVNILWATDYSSQRVGHKRLGNTLNALFNIPSLQQINVMRFGIAPMTVPEHRPCSAGRFAFSASRNKDIAKPPQLPKSYQTHRIRYRFASYFPTECAASHSCLEIWPPPIKRLRT